MPRPAHLLMACVVALLGVGLVMVHSASLSVVTPTPDPSLTWDASFQPLDLLRPMLDRNLLYAAAAVLAMLVGSRVDLRGVFASRGILNPILWALLISVGFCALTLVPGMGKSVNGASRWVQVGPPGIGFSFQPSELMKWTLVLVLAWWCARRRGVMHRFAHGLLPGLGLVALATGLVIIEDLGTAVLIALVAVVVLIAGGARLKQLAWFVPVGLAGLVAAIIDSPYRITRLTTFLDPWADPQGTGYHPIQSMLAFAQGGVAGSGLGQSIQKYYIPEDTTDFVFPIIAEEMGFAGACLVVGLFLAVLWLGLGILRDTKDTFGRLVAIGVLTTVGLQAVINIAVVTVVVPTKGIALPLISAGGTGWILTAFALGLLASLDNAHAMEAEAICHEGTKARSKTDSPQKGTSSHKNDAMGGQLTTPAF